MGNSPSKTKTKTKTKTKASTSSSSRRAQSSETPTTRAQKMVGDMQSYMTASVKKLDDDHPATQFFDTLCGNVFDDDKLRSERSNSYGYSEDVSEDDSRTVSDSDTLDEFDRRRKGAKKLPESESESFISQSDYESESAKKEATKVKDTKRTVSQKGRSEDSQSYFESEDEASLLEKKKGKEKETATSVVTDITSDVGPGQLSKPMASSFAKRCYFTKAGIGKSTQHYEGLTLTGNIVLMLATAMKLKGCPTICDEDLRRVEQTYPNQFSRLPDELLLSSGWRRISKYCHFSYKPIPDGVPFFHSKVRNHPNGGYHFLLAAAVGMIRPFDVEPLTRDTLVLLETDFPTQCDAAPTELIEDPENWTLVDKFCFFSGGPINTEEDVFYQADFDGNPIYMLAFLSPSLTPEELYKLQGDDGEEVGFTNCREVEEVESVYDLTDRDFEDLKLYHLGPCRALPPYILQPLAWNKVLPPHFLAAREIAMMLAQQYEMTYGMPSPGNASHQAVMSPEQKAAMAAAAQLQSISKGSFNHDLQHRIDGESHGYYDEEWDQESNHAGTGPIPPAGMPAPRAPHYHPEQPTMAESPYPPSSQFAPIHQMPSTPGPGQTSRYGYYDQNSLTTRNATQPHIGSPRSYSEEPEWYPDDPQSLTGTPQSFSSGPQSFTSGSVTQESFQREMEEEGAFVDSSAPIDEQLASRTIMTRPFASRASTAVTALSPPGRRTLSSATGIVTSTGSKMDPPVDEPPSLSIRDVPDDEAVHEQYGPDVSPTISGYSSSGMAPLQTSESSYQHQRHPNGGYFRDGEYYDSPDKVSQGDSDYYPREEEYYDSPEALRRAQYPPPSRNSRYPEGGDDEFPPDEFSEGESRLKDYSPEHEYPQPPPRGRNYYVSPDKTETSEAEYSPREGQYYSSPVYTDGTNSPQDTPPEGPLRDFVPPNKTPLPLRGMSPRSEVSARSNPSDYTTSSAMRTAQDLLKKNREKRLSRAKISSVEDEENREIVTSRTDEGSHDSTSEIASVISGSSVWTDNSTGDRSSRRALILQMAKARMKTHKPSIGGAHAEDKTSCPIAEEQSLVSGEDQQWDGLGRGGGTEIDFTGELD